MSSDLLENQMLKKIALGGLLATIATPALADKSLCMFGNMGDNPLMLVEYNAKTVTVDSKMFPELKDVKLPRDNDPTGVGAGTTKPINGTSYMLILRPNVKITITVEKANGSLEQYKADCRKV
jgi:hypothetical protein